MIEFAIFFDFTCFFTGFDGFEGLEGLGAQKYGKIHRYGRLGAQKYDKIRRSGRVGAQKAQNYNKIRGRLGKLKREGFIRNETVCYIQSMCQMRRSFASIPGSWVHHVVRAFRPFPRRHFPREPAELFYGFFTYGRLKNGSFAAEIANFFDNLLCF